MPETIQEITKRLVLDDLNNVRLNKAGSLHNEHVIIADALWYLISQLIVDETTKEEKKQ